MVTVLRFEWTVAALALLIAGALWVIVISQRPCCIGCCVKDNGTDVVQKDKCAHRKYWVSALLLVFGVSCLPLAAARPAFLSTMDDPKISLAVDVSISMGADDVGQTRLAAVQEGVSKWLSQLPEDTRLGLTTFSSEVTQEADCLTASELIEVLKRLQTHTGTALGDGLLAASTGQATTVVVLGDGNANQGVSGSQAAKQLLGDGVRVLAIGIGTEDGQIEWQGQMEKVPATFTDLKSVSAISGTDFRAAKSAEDVYQALRQLDLRQRWVDVGPGFGWLALLFGIAALWVRFSLKLS